MAHEISGRGAIVLAGAAFLGLIPLAEPIVGIFRQTVELNLLFMGLLALVTLVAFAGVIVAFRRDARAPIVGVARTLAIAEIVFLIVVWATIIATDAYGSSVPTDNRGGVDLIHRSAP
jgi:hypothetical protein